MHANNVWIINTLIIFAACNPYIIKEQAFGGGACVCHE
jgi:hypothetical protein